MTGAPARERTERAVACALLLFAGMLSLPLAAAALDGPSTENLILPVQLLAMALLGVVVGHLLPGLAGAGASRGRRTAVGVAAGLAAALLGVLVFFLLISGFSGA